MRRGSFGDRVKLARSRTASESRQAWLLKASLVESSTSGFQARLTSGQAGGASNPKKHLQGAKPPGQDLDEMIDEATPEQLAALRKRLGL